MAISVCFATIPPLIGRADCVARAVHKHEAEVFLLVSSDKAVRPSCVMGATKRVAEFIVRSFAARGARTRFVAVRFGNVLGSFRIS
ncbi:MAG: polysaccharide biosynthesis protein [Elusimicrobiota bacterium]